VNKVAKGATKRWYENRKNLTSGKLPLLNPIVEAMLPHATEKEKWAILVSQRGALRAQHYCNKKLSKKGDPKPPRTNDGDETWTHLLKKNLTFEPNIKNPIAITFATGRDKNHQNASYMERTMKCTCGTPWTCIVHFAQKLFLSAPYKDLPGSAALVQCETGDMTYTAMLKIIKTLTAKIGLDPKNYGTHSGRSGGISELDIEGRQASFIKAFAWFKNVSSIYKYIKPANPDLLKFRHSHWSYKQSRMKEVGLSTHDERPREDLLLAVKQERDKIRSVFDRQALARIIAARAQGPVRGSLNKTSHQQRSIPPNVPGGPASQLNARFDPKYANARPKPYTDYSKSIPKRSSNKPVRNDNIVDLTLGDSDDDCTVDTAMPPSFVKGKSSFSPGNPYRYY
jgi:hypothetical protein